MSSEPREITAALRRVVGGLSGGFSTGKHGGSDIVAILGCWDEVVGDQVAVHARPRRLVEGVLLVEVDEPGWATQLRYLRARMVTEINEHLGRDVVGSIKLRVARA